MRKPVSAANLANATAAACRNAVLVRAMLDFLGKDATQSIVGPGLPSRRRSAGPLTVSCVTHQGEDLLDAYLEGHGKVAAFRVNAPAETFEVVSIKVRLLPRWVERLGLTIVSDRSAEIIPFPGGRNAT
jgi:hypothetical protein